MKSIRPKIAAFESLGSGLRPGEPGMPMGDKARLIAKINTISSLLAVVESAHAVGFEPADSALFMIGATRKSISETS
jgi:hypothetical protein